MDKKITKVQIASIFIIVFLFGTISGYLLNGAKSNYFGKNTEPVLGKSLQLGLIEKIWNILQEEYLYNDELSSSKAVFGAAEGLVSSAGDPYTSFLEPVINDEFEYNLFNDLEGIGSEVIMENGYLTVVTVLKNSPALEAGLQPGDVIYKVEDLVTADLDIYEAVSLIRGPAGTSVNLTVIREGEEYPLDFTITRSKLDLPILEVEVLEDGIVYVNMTRFSDGMTSSLSEYYDLFKSPDTKGIIWDLRYNPGGLLGEAIKISSEFVPEGEAVSWKKYKNFKEAIRAIPGHQNLIDLSKPMIVLLNEGSASASEIFAGVLMDYDLANIVGTQSTGKGSMQEIVDLPGGSSLKFTTAEWLTPNETNINGIGISPDFEVELNIEDLRAGRDPQMQKALELLSEDLVIDEEA